MLHLEGCEIEGIEFMLCEVMKAKKGNVQQSRMTLRYMAAWWNRKDRKEDVA